MPNLQTADFAQSHRPEALWSLGMPPGMVPQTATLQEVISYLGDDTIQERSCVLVVRGQRLVGLVTDRDAIRLMGRPAEFLLAAPP